MSLLHCTNHERMKMSKTWRDHGAMGSRWDGQMIIELDFPTGHRRALTAVEGEIHVRKPPHV